MQRKELVSYGVAAHGLSLRKCCKALGVSLSYYAYRPKARDDSEVISALSGLADKKPTWGFSKLFTMLRNQGKPWNHKRVWRVYCSMGLNKRRKHFKRRLPGKSQCVVQPLAANYCWSVDFMRDTLYSGRVYWIFNVIDDYNREALATEVDINLPAGRVLRVLDRIAEDRGCYPERIRSDNGPELSGSLMATWAGQLSDQV